MRQTQVYLLLTPERVGRIGAFSMGEYVSCIKVQAVTNTNVRGDGYGETMVEVAHMPDGRLHKVESEGIAGGYYAMGQWYGAHMRTEYSTHYQLDGMVGSKEEALAYLEKQGFTMGEATQYLKALPNLTGYAWKKPCSK
tara:strand:+ start:585 stop:1001 length:417 start_codon:yes stop_codon:yes gene_type:complete